MLSVGSRHLLLVAAFAVLPLIAPQSARADLILTKAGTGTAGAVGDGSLAAGAQLSAPRGVARLADGSVLIADSGNNRVRRIAPDGTITTVAGSGVAGSAGDTGPAQLAQLNGPRDVAAAPDGISYYVADTGGNRIRFVNGATGIITTFAGTGTAAFSGDGSAAALATLSGPSGVGVTASGAVLIADTANNRIRQVTGGTITTVAGTGTASSTGDGSPALLATINAPQDVSAVSGGGFLVADTGGNKIRRVDGSGTITTVAGAGGACTAGSLCGDYGPAGLALLNAPAAVTADATGTGYLVSDTGSNRVRRVSAGGIITTVAGSGTACATPTLLCGDAGPAALALLNAPRAALDLPDGSLLIADSGTNRLRARVPDASGATGPAGATGLPGAPGLAGVAGTDGADGAPGRSGATGPAGADGAAGAPGAPGQVLVPQLTASFAATKLTGRTARPTVLRIVLTRGAVVTVRVKRGVKTVATLRRTFHTPGRKQLLLGRLRAATYAVTLTATDGAAQSVDRAALRVLPGR